jgi:pimeloyl-ACP methyl ester carboxylesterase
VLFMAFTSKLLKTSLIVGGVLGALAIYNKVTESLAGELDTVLTGEERRYAWKYGDMFYDVKGDPNARPLVLIHSFGPGASSYEWRKNIDELATQFRVYAPDLLGFGLSDRPSVDYDAEMYADLISDFVKEVVGKPAIVVAHGLSCAYVIAGAYRRPQVFERLILVAPPSSIVQEDYPGPLDGIVKNVVRLPIIGQFVYNLLTSRQAIRGYYDKQGYHDPVYITDELVEYVYTSAHQPDSRYVAASLFGKSLNLDVHEPFARLQIPVIALWGREDQPAVETSDTFQRLNGRVEVRLLDKSTVQLQDEQARHFDEVVQNFASLAIR